MATANVQGFDYNEQTALEALLFVLQRTQDKTIHHVFKLLYSAEKYHLRRFGMPILGDEWAAMKHGPVPSRLYDCYKSIRGDHAELPETSAHRKAYRAVGTCGLEDSRMPDVRFLSRSMIQALEASLETEYHKSFHDLSEDSHDAAWMQAYPGGNSSGRMTLRSIVDVVDESGGLSSYIRDSGFER